MPVRTCAAIKAAAAPAAIRAMTTTSGVGASPHANDATVKPPSPARNIRRYPRASPSRALITSSIA
jgi:hypothetical protein